MSDHDQKRREAIADMLHRQTDRLILRSLARRMRRHKDEQEWNRQYDEAVQGRDWQTCDYLLDERETADWYVRKEPAA